MAPHAPSLTIQMRGATIAASRINRARRDAKATKKAATSVQTDDIRKVADQRHNGRQAVLIFEERIRQQHEEANQVAQAQAQFGDLLKQTLRRLESATKQETMQ
jgi:hypothetical protein